MKKIIALVLSVVMVLALAACGGQKAANTPAAGTENNAEAAAIKVALLLSGSRGDGAYLDYVCAGADKAAAELPIELKVLEIADAADYESNLVAMADAGYDVIIGGSTWFAEPITTHAAEYPNVKFIELDGVAEGENVVSVNFSFKDGGYLAGVAAAMLSTKTDIPGVDGAKVIGYVGGIDVPTLQWIEAGYKAGAASVDPDIQVLSAYVGSFSDPTTAKELAIAQIDAGANVIIASAGGSGLGVLEAASEAGVYCIGFDQYETGNYASSFFTTVERGIDSITYDVIKSITDGDWVGGQEIVCSVENGYCGLSDMENFKSVVGEAFPQDIPDRIDEVISQMKSGEIVMKDE